MNEPIAFQLRGEYIPLNSLLKAVGIAATGAEASRLIMEEKVKVDGELELRKSRKIRSGQTVFIANQCINIQS